jgi:hypothetical protein
VCRTRWEENVERSAKDTSSKVILNHKSEREKKQLTNEVLKRNISSQYVKLLEPYREKTKKCSPKITK